MNGVGGRSQITVVPQSKKNKTKEIHQIKISEHSTDRQNQMETSSSHTSLYFQEMWSSRFWKRPNRSPPAMAVPGAKKRRRPLRNPGFFTLHSQSWAWGLRILWLLPPIFITALVLSFFYSLPVLLYVSEVDYTHHYFGCPSSFTGQSNAHATYLSLPLYYCRVGLCTPLHTHTTLPLLPHPSLTAGS